MAGNENDAGIRAALIVAARTQMNREDTSHFNISGLCAAAGVSRAQFRRCFSGKEALITAVLNEDVTRLQDIASTAAAPRVSLAAANGAPMSTPTPAPAPDAWLERRLRVFERALAALEMRQEKFEQMLNRSVALLEERVISPVEIPHIQATAPDIPTQIPPATVETSAAVTKMAPMPLPEPDPQSPITPKEMEDLLANARRVAREAAVVVPPPKPRGVPRWMAWTAVCCLLLMVLTALALGNVAGASVPAVGVSHRQIVQPALARMTALADSGDARGQTMLALTYLHGQYSAANPIAALHWGLAAAEQGDPMAQYLIGTLYQDGAGGVAADPRRAFDWFEAAALRGNIKAMHDLAIAYAEGRGVARDPSRAAAWFNRAAEQGYVDSQFDLAVLYERGDGVRQNPIAALRWYLIAAKTGDVQARQRAGQLADEMQSEDIARARTLAARFTPASRDLAANML